MAQLPFVDTHVHFWDLKDPCLEYVWLQPDWFHPIIGDIDGLKVQRYAADEFIAETRFQNVSKSVHVQAAIGIEDPVNETKWLQSYADRTGHPHGIVAHCDLAADDAASVLERHYEYPNIRGIRDFGQGDYLFGQGDYLIDEAWHRGYSLLEKYEYVFCLDPVWENLEKTRDLAQKFPGITLSVDHAGFPRARDDEHFRNWRRGIEAAAEAENIIVKISGLGMCDPLISPLVSGMIRSAMEGFADVVVSYKTHLPAAATTSVREERDAASRPTHTRSILHKDEDGVHGSRSVSAPVE